ncbi:hypothetical protein ACTXOR_08620 [Arthrobacter rhombi]|uniref:hypothetical protein n=1 Tax=Arthrobacter rhombi TaxID=71253 RepID=UPI003FD4AF12
MVEVRWNGKFAGDVSSPMDFKHVAAYVVPVGTPADLTDQAGVVTGELGDSVQVQVEAGVYDVYLAAWSLSGKVSDLAGPVSVVAPVPADAEALLDAIEAVQASANGKNTVTYDTRPPAAEDEGIAGDSWLVGQTGRTSDVVEATNLATNPSFTTLANAYGNGNLGSGGGAEFEVSGEWSSSGSTSLKISADATQATTVYGLNGGAATVADAGKTLTVSADMHLNAPMTGYQAANARRITITTMTPAGGTNLYHAVSDTAPNTVGTHRLSVMFTLPADITGWGFRYYAGGGGVDVFWDSLDIAETPTPRPYFDGDTESGETNNDSHYRWTGAPHASTSVKYLPALDIGESDTWNVTEQYRHDGEGWVRVELSHYVFSSVDLGKATVGELDGVRIKGRTVSGEQLSGDAIDGKIITGAVIQSPGDGAGYQLTEGGYTSRDADGNVTVRIPADGSTAQFRGDLEAKSLTASGRVSLQAPENEITSGAALVLESGVQAPASPPTVGTAYETLQFPKPPNGEAVSGLAFADGLWWRGVNGVDAQDRIEALDATGAIVRSFPVENSIRHGITAIGSEIFVLGIRNAQATVKRYVSVYGVDGAFKRRWEYTAYGTGRYEPGIGTDGTSVYIAQCWKDGLLTWRIYNKSDGTQTGQVDTTYKFATDVSGVYVGQADVGTKRVFVSKAGGTTATEQFTTVGTQIDWGSWYSAGKARALGFVWHDGAFHHLTDQGMVVRYSSIKRPTGVWENDSPNWWVAQSWVGSGGEETRVGDARRFTFIRRSVLQLSGGEVPPGVTGARFYLARKDTLPTRNDFHLLEESAGASGRVSELPASWETGQSPPSANTFPESEPATVKSRIGGFEVKGDGSGTWGPLTFNADGTMTSAEVPAWVPVTTFNTPFRPAGFGYAPAYRIWPSGLVEWRGVVESTGTTGDALLFPAPPGTIPAQTVNLVGAADTQADITVRVEFGNPLKGNEIAKYPQRGKPNVWTSLDGMSYYLE